LDKRDERAAFAVTATEGNKSMTKIRSAFLAIATLSTSFAWKATPAQRAACTGDALRLCASYVPDEERVAGCLMSKKSQLSAPCLAQFK
jgi:hypothetical protein